jgi:hypothetical protein
MSSGETSMFLDINEVKIWKDSNRTEKVDKGQIDVGYLDGSVLLDLKALECLAM